MIDGWGLSRRIATLVSGLAIALVGLAPASSLGALAIMDRVAGEMLVVAGVFAMSLLVGWRMEDPARELLEGASPSFQRLVPFALFLVRYLIPPFILVILWISVRDAISVAFG